MMRKVLLSLLMLVAVLPQAFAHAHLKRSEPAAGSTVTAPAELVLEFSESVEPGLSQITLTDASGQPVAVGPLARDVANPATLRLPVPNGLHGGYRVKWRAVSVDSHASKGDFTFTIAP